MPYSTRNAYYLRASNYRTIPLFLYLDERHTDWMSDRILQLVIAELQSKMQELLKYSGRARSGPGEAGKKHKVYVERGEGYQYCYFLRGTSRTEVVLLKRKTFSLRPSTPPPRAQTPAESPSRSRSSRPTSARSDRSRTRSRSASLRPVDDNSGEAHDGQAEEEEEEDVKPEIGEDGEVNVKDYKPDVAITYKGFGTSSLQLVLIIEPYPPLPSHEYAPPSSRLSTRSASVASTSARARTQASRTSRSNMSGSRYSSIAPSAEPSSAYQPSSLANAPNMRNASRSISSTPQPQPNSRRDDGTASSSTPFGSTPGPGAFGDSSGLSGAGRSSTPLFLPGARDTPFDMDDEDAEAHLAYTQSLREGRVRLPSIGRPAGSEEGMSKGDRRNVRRRIEEEEDEGEDEPEGMERLGERLVRSSQIEEGVVRVSGGWEERQPGEGSEVLGLEEPGD